MRIAVMSWEALYGIRVGGVAVHVSRLAQELHRQGHAVHVFTRIAPRQRLHDAVFGVSYHRCPVDPRASFVEEIEAMCEVFLRYLREETARSGPFDLIHCHDWLTAPAGMAARGRFGLPYVQTYHSTEWGRTGRWPEHGEPRRIADIEQRASEQADAVIVATHDTRRLLDQAYHCPDWKKSVIHHGVDLASFDGKGRPVSEVRAEIGIGEHDPAVLFVGRLDWRKGADRLVDIAARTVELVPGLKFLLVGEGELESRLREQVASRSLEGTVRFLGWREGREQVDLYRASDVVCCPSRADSFGVVTLSAWAAGKPVVATPVGAPGEFVKHEDTGVLVDPEKEDLAATLTQLFSDRERMRWMGRNGRIAVETAFTWEVAARRTLEAYARARSMVEGKQ